jgi:hypothetical protein
MGQSQRRGMEGLANLKADPRIKKKLPGRRLQRLIERLCRDVVDFHKFRYIRRPLVTHKRLMDGMIVITGISGLVPEFH